MALDVGDSMGPNALVGSVLFVGSGTALAQDNTDFYYDPATNTLKTKDQTSTTTSSFSIGTGTVTTGNGSSSSGPLTINTGGQPNESGSGSAGNSGTVTLSTGPGGAASGGSAPGVSANLLLKTGEGGGNAQAGGTGGNAGHIILQPGSGGSGTAQGAGACGAANQPSFWVQGGGVGYGVWADALYIEDARSETACRVESVCGLTLRHGYFEPATGESHLDADGVVEVVDTGFSGCTGANVVVLRGAGSTLSGCWFLNTPSAETILVDAERVRLNNLRLESHQTGAAITLTADALRCQLDSIYLYQSGRLDTTAPNDTSLSNIFVLYPTAATGTYAIDIGNGNLVRATVNGLATSTCHGFRVASGSVTDFEVYSLNGGNGITAGWIARVTSGRCYALNGGQEFVLSVGSLVKSITDSNNLSERNASLLPITGGVITKSTAKITHTVDTEGGAATDDLNTINGVYEGDVFYLRTANDARSIVFKHGTGNIQCAGNADITLDSTNDVALCFYNGTKVIVSLLNAGT